MPILDFDKLTPDNQAVKDLKDLIQLTVFQNEDMERFMTFMPNVTNGKKAGFIGEMEDIGIAGSGCDPEYKKSGYRCRPKGMGNRRLANSFGNVLYRLGKHHCQVLP